jgi:RimJ/RimL family protein N-acetyltransferase/N-acetylglutamate synthase-like GNAT family acetyltransferase
VSDGRAQAVAGGGTDRGQFELTGSLATLAHLTLDHVPGLVWAATEDRSSFAFTRVPADAAGMTTHVQALLGEQRTGATVPFVILDSDSGRVLGMTRYLGLDYWNGSATPSVAEIGSTWLCRSAQGTGVNREAKHLMLDHAFRVWGVHRVSFRTDARNGRSRRAIEALGATFEGVQRAHKPAADGGVRDTAWYSILAQEWLSTDETALGMREMTQAAEKEPSKSQLGHPLANPWLVGDAQFREASPGDFDAIFRIYCQLNADDPTSPRAGLREVFDHILVSDGLRLLVLELDGVIVATTYLNVIPNLTRGGRPYAVIENVVVDESLRGRGVGKTLMAHTLDAAWAAGCYKAMLLTGSKQESTHAFYRSCGFAGDDKTAYVARPATGHADAL